MAGVECAMPKLTPRETDFIDVAPIQLATVATVAATPDEVWAVIADNERWPERFKAAKACRTTSDVAGGSDRRDGFTWTCSRSPSVSSPGIRREGGFTFSFRGVAVANRGVANVCGRSSGRHASASAPKVASARRRSTSTPASGRTRTKRFGTCRASDKPP